MKTKKIEKPYLMWVGAKHYPTIKDYVDEAVDQGVSKRTVNAAVAKTLIESGSVVFLAHDEGQKKDCTECTGIIDCPNCRKIQNEIEKLLAEKKSVIEHKEDVTEERYDKLLRRVQKRLDKRTIRMDDCNDCLGTGRLEAGTGGVVEFCDGSEMDFRKYMYWKRQPKKWTEDDQGGILEMGMCENCGGNGVVPQGVVFGMFLPTKIEYVLKPEDDLKVKKDMKKNGFELIETTKLKSEKKRGCGFRKPGGYYVTTNTTEKSKSIEEKIQELVEAGHLKNEEVFVSGSFVQFLSPIKIDAKRFRGLKKWSLDPDVEDEADIILDSFE